MLCLLTGCSAESGNRKLLDVVVEKPVEPVVVVAKPAVTVVAAPVVLPEITLVAARTQPLPTLSSISRT